MDTTHNTHTDIWRYRATGAANKAIRAAAKDWPQRTEDRQTFGDIEPQERLIKPAELLAKDWRQQL